MLDLNSDLLLKVSNIAIQAGSEIMKYYPADNEIITKVDNSPLTQADLSSNNLIIKELRKINQTTLILSEESLVDWVERKQWNQYWLIDPLDGTKEFINKNGEFTVNIALIEQHKPILGIIYAPTKSLLYFAKKNYGAFKIFSSSQLVNLDEAQSISISQNQINNNIRIIGSRSHSNDIFKSWIKERFNKYNLITKGSSIKFCEIAEGKADIYPRFGATSEWDIAAGHIILEEAGGFLKDIGGNNILYNNKESLINPEFIATNNLDFF